MRQQFILYTMTNPFRGYLYAYGKVDTSETPDGSTLYEHIQNKLSENPDLRLHIFSTPVTLSEEIRETKKFDIGSSSLVSQEPADITPAEKAATVEVAKVQALVDNLPSWAAVSSAVDGISNLADAKVFLKKLARVVYWLAKNSEV